MATALVGLMGVFAGGLLTIIGQRYSIRFEQRAAQQREMVDACAVFIAHEQDFRNRIWEERHSVAEGAVETWDVLGSAKAEARVRIWSQRDPGLAESVVAVSEAGKALGGIWRTRSGDESEVEVAWQRHRNALDHLVEVSGTSASLGLGR